MNIDEARTKAREWVWKATGNLHTIMASESGDVNAMRLPFKELRRRRSNELEAALDLALRLAEAAGYHACCGDAQAELDAVIAEVESRIAATGKEVTG